MMIRLRDVSFAYPSGARVLDRVSLEITAGLTLLLGPNGAGKSTLLKIGAGIERPDSGSVEIDSFDLWKDEVAARRKLAYVSEHPDLTPYATIRDVIYLVCRLRSEPLESGDAVLHRAGLSDVAGRSIRELSMGQRRRAVIAAAWIGQPMVAILDEPLEAMDRLIRKEILMWIDRLLANGAAVLVATHQIEPFIEKTTRVIRARSGSCQLLDSLPADLFQRTKVLEAAAGNRE